MEVAIRIIGATCTVVTGCYASTRDLEDFRGPFKWYTFVKLLVWTALVYGGYLATLGISSRVLGTGALPARLHLGSSMCDTMLQARQSGKVSCRPVSPQYSNQRYNL
ncbi:hypothetical protein PSACC_00001 [Paramicrosporidium saccamoebae]|uniref:Uncharacterized protein n=1 Tax=Paramicrosporidium saccamoebae TaxID=1246581 RepID=A0A2H9TR14_9FUNG|nr:hypothetical protein PSACC_00001 [Paramicrosporidium saccamoebae]